MPCDHAMYPHLSSTLHNVSGFAGVDLLKYGKPPAVFDFESVEFAEAMRANIRFEASHPSSTWQTTAQAPAARFQKTPYSTLKVLGGILGGTIPENRAGLRTKVRAELANIKDEDVPDAFDSRANWPACAALIGEIRDQSACGSCYAVSAASAATDRFCIAKEGKVTHADRLAGADLMDCCKTCAGSNGGCDGGTPSHCWDYMTTQGLASGGAFGDHTNCLMYPWGECSHHDVNTTGTKPVCPPTPYNSPTCFWACDSDTTSKITYDESQAAHKFVHSYLVEGNVKTIQAEILAHGPVQGGMYLTPEFEMYTGGVFQTTNTKWIGAHAIKIVGWGVDNSTGTDVDYWRVQNSWNSEWGEKGYFRILRGSNMLGIEGSIVAGSM